jgi:hypothetical protein
MAHKMSLHRAFYQLGYWLGKYFLIIIIKPRNRKNAARGWLTELEFPKLGNWNSWS